MSMPEEKSIAKADRPECQVARIMDQARSGHPPGPQDILYLLKMSDASLWTQIFTTARAIREQHFGPSVFLYGFLYFSTYCRNSCRFCHYRQDNPHSPRYRKTQADIMSAARRLTDSGVHLLDLTMGEDPVFFQQGSALIDLVREIKQTIGLPLMVSPGVIPDTYLDELKSAGADWYACYQETHDLDLFQWLRPDQDYQTRWQQKMTARKRGWLVEEGVLCGVGESSGALVRSIQAMRELGADQVRAMQFVPQAGTPMEHLPVQDPWREIKLIALLRLSFPDRLIPASLDVAGLAGLESRLQAGANVVTSLVPPGEGLAGVSNSKLDIDSDRRSPAAVIPVLRSLGLVPAENGDLERWMLKRRSSC